MICQIVIRVQVIFSYLLRGDCNAMLNSTKEAQQMMTISSLLQDKLQLTEKCYQLAHELQIYRKNVENMDLPTRTQNDVLLALDQRREMENALRKRIDILTRLLTTHSVSFHVDVSVQTESILCTSSCLKTKRRFLCERDALQMEPCARCSKEA